MSEHSNVGFELGFYYGEQYIKSTAVKSQPTHTAPCQQNNRCTTDIVTGLTLNEMGVAEEMCNWEEWGPGGNLLVVYLNLAEDQTWLTLYFSHQFSSISP